MTRKTWLLSATPILLAAAVAAQSPKPSAPDGTPVAGEDGSSLFRTYCASCHGPAALGDGPLARSLGMAPPDLTRLAGHNRGKFDKDAVARTIDGRDPVKGHGGPEMPVWGDILKRARGGYSEKQVRDRVDALVEYLQRLQAKESPRP
jgi:mono/diheme cytochrome c family protein